MARQCAPPHPLFSSSQSLIISQRSFHTNQGPEIQNIAVHSDTYSGQLKLTDNGPCHTGKLWCSGHRFFFLLIFDCSNNIVTTTGTASVTRLFPIAFIGGFLTILKMSFQNSQTTQIATRVNYTIVFQRWMGRAGGVWGWQRARAVNCVLWFHHNPCSLF